jgi:alkanesulfonate monooxygenase SsuD/methylene tetrahydromethanopterin reductase-like flavin-dependent oxidoreductase (luciferase family)
MHLNLGHPKSSKLALTDINYTVEFTKKAEASLFDSIFLADVLGLWNDVQTTPFNWLEPLTTLAALSMVTDRIGLIAIASTTYTEPFNLARYFSLDHISRTHRLEHRHNPVAIALPTIL